MPTLAFQNWFVRGILAIFIFGLTALVVQYFLVPPNATKDPLLERAYKEVEKVTAYTQIVETEVTLSDRTLHIRGTYYHNGPENRFESIATTTLILPKQERHSFSLHNISIGDDVYTKLETTSPVLQSTILPATAWQHFKKDAIPLPFVNIAVSGPILDGLRVLSAGGIYLSATGSPGDTRWDDELLQRYTFVRAEQLPPAGGTLATLLDRIGPMGTVDVWIYPENARVRHIVVTSENYHSTTTITDINMPRAIAPPIP